MNPHKMMTAAERRVDAAWTALLAAQGFGGDGSAVAEYLAAVAAAEVAQGDVLAAEIHDWLGRGD